jgi:glycosyltransferase involved in cell wall biosynthesis
MKKFIFFSLLFIFSCSRCHLKEIKPKISIITSVYKGDEFIEGFLKDITNQTIFNQCELIMINANSPGNEEKMIKEYMKKYKNIIYVKLKKDPGIYTVWNMAIKMALADFITNANLDDRSCSNALEIQLKELESHLDIDLVYTEYIITIKANETLLKNSAIIHNNPLEFSKENMKYCLPGPRPVWRKSIHDRYGFFDETFTSAGDYEMWLRAANLGAKYKKIPKITTLYYFNQRGLSTDKDKKKTYQRFLEHIRIIQKYGHLFFDESI